MGYTAKNIITQARKFEEASLLLEQKTIEMTKLQNSTNPVSIQRQSTDGYIEPSLALFGFSLELYLKAIFLHENGKPTCGHEIPKQPVRQAIINRINQLQIIHYPLD